MSALVFDAVSVEVRSRALLTRVSLGLEGGDFLAVLGPNGAGKTTLLRTALGLVRLASGVVRVDASSVARLSARERAAELAWLPQEPLAAEAISALEAVLAARYRFSESPATARKAALAALERVGMQAFAGALLTELSGGERQRIAIAALLAQEARFLLLDEPANHLDPARQAETYARLGSVLAAGVGILCVTHDVNLLAHVGGTPRVAGLSEGKLRFDTSFGASELPDRLAELFGVPMHTAVVGRERLILPMPGSPRGGAP
jgi:iron complex transport system ATP-binding protein